MVSEEEWTPEVIAQAEAHRDSNVI